MTPPAIAPKNIPRQPRDAIFMPSPPRESQRSNRSQKSAVAGNRLAANITGLFGREECRECGKFFRPPHAPGRYLRRRLLFVDADLADPLGQRVTGHEGIDGA